MNATSSLKLRIVLLISLLFGSHAYCADPNIDTYQARNIAELNAITNIRRAREARDYAIESLQDLSKSKQIHKRLLEDQLIKILKSNSKSKRDWSALVQNLTPRSDSILKAEAAISDVPKDKISDFLYTFLKDEEVKRFISLAGKLDEIDENVKRNTKIRDHRLKKAHANFEKVKKETDLALGIPMEQLIDQWLTNLTADYTKEEINVAWLLIKMRKFVELKWPPLSEDASMGISKEAFEGQERDISVNTGVVYAKIKAAGYQRDSKFGYIKKKAN